jgi:hypothetical protein
MPSSGREVREYLAGYGCVRVLTVAVVAVTVAVRNTGRPSALQAAAQARALHPLAHSSATYPACQAKQEAHRRGRKSGGSQCTAC